MFKGLLSLIRKNPSHSHRLSITSSISLFSSTPTEPACSNPSITMFDYLLKQQNFSPEAAERASFTIMQHVGRFPEVLSVSLDKFLRPKIKIFLDLGFTPAETADLVCYDPFLLRRSAENRLGPSLMVLLNILGSVQEVRRLLKASSWFLKHDLEKIMLPNIEYLKSIGICSSQIVRYIFNFPRFFLLKPESISAYAGGVDEMGLDRKSNMYLPAIRVISSMSLERWHLKLNVFRSLGLSENDIVDQFRRSPPVLAASTRIIM